MSKVLKDIIGETYFPKNKDEQNFWQKHQVELFKNAYSSQEYDPLFKGTKVKISPREADRHGYSGGYSPKGGPHEPSPEGNDEKHYEEVELGDETIDESTVRQWMSDFEKALPDEDRKKPNWEHAYFHFKKGASAKEAAKTHEPLKPQPFGSGMRVKRGK